MTACSVWVLRHWIVVVEDRVGVSCVGVFVDIAELEGQYREISPSDGEVDKSLSDGLNQPKTWLLRELMGFLMS